MDTISLPKSNFASLSTEAEDFLKNISRYENIVVFSPHLDDAILSMGALLSYLDTLGKQIQIINFFTKGSGKVSTLTKKLISQGGEDSSESYFQKRRKEDDDAFSKFHNVKIINLDFIDAPWRETKEGEILYPDTVKFREISQEDDVAILVRAKLKEIVFQNALLFAPLARGRHIDHQITRNVVTDLYPNVIYYSDFPYLHDYENEIEFIQEHSLICTEVSLGSEQKRELIRAYESQGVSLFGEKPLLLAHEIFYHKKI